MLSPVWLYDDWDGPVLARGTDEFGRRTVVTKVPFVKRWLVVAYRKCYCPTCGQSRKEQNVIKRLRDAGVPPESIDFGSLMFPDTKAVPKAAPLDPIAHRNVAYAFYPGFVEEGVPLWKALVGYAREGDYEQAEIDEQYNLITSKDPQTKLQMPIIDLDYSHRYVPSSTPGHGHLYLNRPISRWRWYVLMFGLRTARVIEPGNFWWSLRRGENCTRSEPMKRLVKTSTYSLLEGGSATSMTVPGHEDVLLVVRKLNNTWSWLLYEQASDDGVAEYMLVRSGSGILKKSQAKKVGKDVLIGYITTTRSHL